MKKVILSFTAVVLLTNVLLAQQNTNKPNNADKKVSKKGDKKSMTSKHDPSMSKRTEIKNPPATK